MSSVDDGEEEDSRIVIRFVGDLEILLHFETLKSIAKISISDNC